MLWILSHQICFYIGLMACLFTLAKFVSRFLLPALNLYARYGGGWAVVTGGTDGIGLGFCQELAKRGFNVCVISRNKQKIDNVCQDLKKINPQILTKSISADFANSFQEGFYQKIIQQLKDIQISILVNNVGALTDVGLFGQSAPSDIFKQSTLNMMPAAMMTRWILPNMLKRQRKSGIITLSSYSSLMRLAKSVNYCSTKLFDDFLSRSLEYEYGNKVDFLSVRPALVTTSMARNLNSFLHVSKNQCAKGALNSLGRYSQYSGSWWHQIQVFATQQMTQFSRDKVMGSIWSRMGEQYKQIDSKKQKNI